MLLFRSEEHVHRWCAANNLPPGAILSLDQGWRLADAWYRNRLDPGWRRKTVDEAEAIFAALDLSGPFWRLRP